MSVGAVYDCMIYLQAAFKPRRVHATFQLVEQGEVTLHISAEILEEIRNVLSRPQHLRRFPALTHDQIDVFLVHLASLANLTENVPAVFEVSRDPKDSKYVNLAIAVNAPFLVTWDRDLLDLMNESTPQGREFRARYPSLQILNPVRFVEIVPKPSA